MEDPTRRNVDNAYRFAERHGIRDPKKLTMDEIKEGLMCCKDKQREARKKPIQ